MNACFADTHFYLALLSEKDEDHERALALDQSLDSAMVTTEWVLTEVADALSAPACRGLVLELIEALGDDVGVLVQPATHELFERGLHLYSERFDKGWSLTDCISFVVMQDQGIQDALTADHHFEQAGFRALLR